MATGTSLKSRNTIYEGKKLYLQDNEAYQGNNYDVVIETISVDKTIINPNGEISHCALVEDERE